MNEFLAKYFLFLPGQALRGEYTLKYIHEFEKSQWMKKSELEEIQWNKIIKLINYAYENSTYYRRLYKKHGINPSEIVDKKDLLKIPYLTKDALRYDQDDMFTPLAKKERISYKTTGGSTGQAVTVAKSMKARACQDAAMWRCLRWFDVDIGDKQARFWGVPFSRFGQFKQKALDCLMNRVRLSGFNYDDRVFTKFYDTLIKFKPKYFYGYVSIIKDFAYFCSENNLDTSCLKLKAIVTTSEPLYDDTKDYLQKVFHCPVVNDYGSGETGPIAYTCNYGGFHLMTDNLFIEIITEDNQQARPGEKGEVVVTELNNYIMPLIRYNIKDIVELGASECVCGRGLPVINNVAGRDRDVLLSANGTKVHGAFINYIAQQCKKNGLGLKQYQVVQSKIYLVTVYIIADYGYTSDTRDFIVDKLKEVLGNDVSVEVLLVNKIDREKSGKLRVVKCEI